MLDQQSSDSMRKQKARKPQAISKINVDNTSGNVPVNKATSVHLTGAQSHQTHRHHQSSHHREPYLRKHHNFVCRVCSPHVKASVRKTLIGNATNREIYAICECIKNVVNRCCPITDDVRAKLSRFRKPLSALSLQKRKLGVSVRKKILIQRGSGIFLPLIASAVISYLLK